MASNNQSRRIQGFWSNFQNQRQFLDDLALKLGIKEKKDWGSISTKVITANGGRTLLNHHNGSLYRALKHVYKGIYHALYNIQKQTGNLIGSLRYQEATGMRRRTREIFLINYQISLEYVTLANGLE